MSGTEPRCRCEPSRCRNVKDLQCTSQYPGFDKHCAAGANLRDAETLKICNAPLYISALTNTGATSMSHTALALQVRNACGSFVSTCCQLPSREGAIKQEQSCSARHCKICLIHKSKGSQNTVLQRLADVAVFVTGVRNVSNSPHGRGGGGAVSRRATVGRRLTAHRNERRPIKTKGSDRWRRCLRGCKRALADSQAMQLDL